MDWFLEEIYSIHGQPCNPERTSVRNRCQGPASIAVLGPAIPEVQPDKIVDKNSNAGPLELGVVLAVVVEHHEIGVEEEIVDVFVIDIFRLDNAEKAAIAF